MLSDSSHCSRVPNLVDLINNFTSMDSVMDLFSSLFMKFYIQGSYCKSLSRCNICNLIKYINTQIHKYTVAPGRTCFASCTSLVLCFNFNYKKTFFESWNISFDRWKIIAQQQNVMSFPLHLAPLSAHVQCLDINRHWWTHNSQLVIISRFKLLLSMKFLKNTNHVLFQTFDLVIL